ncbi:hypothetical protein METBIDRAFT_31013 [Metschnikowia bicuspidata var. bicuspidata NRRL YB-4993]|uniref:Uncharacterized protein n=1 Tax=Metschnikowia bicuspidata var. bicuspidata NRRL YB-4993 TaxID=869754 RepID=A0A1A0HDP2_9ASCO|nr:hypothetical protein METBIDRAFT_31013 [Metschnikowia bicuspidata var. bicuspidata NRRL YB-4993]OBA22043.1 hypothetical protein METBIDRAFT_31013 [Metschnikowia bicuspidata var. bicuspidata NRRL YB-4993]
MSAAPSTPTRPKALAMGSYTPKSASALRKRLSFERDKFSRASKRSPFLGKEWACDGGLPKPLDSPENSDCSVFSEQNSSATTPITPLSTSKPQFLMPTPLTIGTGRKPRGETGYLRPIAKSRSLLASLQAIRDQPSKEPSEKDASKANGLLEAPEFKNDFGKCLKNSGTYFSPALQLNVSLFSTGQNAPVTSSGIAEMTLFEAKKLLEDLPDRHDANNTPHTPLRKPRIAQNPQFELFVDSDGPVHLMRVEDLDKIPRMKVTNPFIDQDPRDEQTEKQVIDYSTHMEMVNTRTGERKVVVLSEEQRRFKPKKLDFTLAVASPRIPDYKITNKYLGSNIGKNFTMGETGRKGMPDFDIFKDRS